MSFLTRWGRRFTSRLQGLRRRHALDAETRAFVRHNRRVWGERPGGGRPERAGPGAGPPPAGNGEGVILTDLHELHPVLVVESYLLPLLARRHGARVISHSLAGREPYGLPQHRRGFAAVLESMGIREHHRVQLSPDALAAARDEAELLLRGVAGKDELLALTVRSVNVGLDVYESHLRWHGIATVELPDPRLTEMLATALALLSHWEAYFADHPIRAVVSSHDTYVEMNTVVRLAWREGIPVYIPRPNHIMRPRAPLTYGSSFSRYPELFRALPPEVQEEGLARARRELGARLKGEQGGLVYMENLAFRPEGPTAGGATAASAPARILADDGRPCPVVFAHCFSDAPHVWGGLLFPDFVEWLRFVAEVARETDFHWYLKSHPACEEASLPLLREAGLLAPEGPFHLIPGRTPHTRLIQEGMTAALTAYGTIGHELPLLGVPVVNAGYNPHVGYSFTWTPSSREDYRNLLLRLPELAKVRDLDPQEVFEFYFMHNYRAFSDDLVFPSFRGLIAELGGHDQTCTPQAYARFLESWSAERHREIIEGMEAFLESGAVFSWEVDDPTRLLPLLRQVS